MNWNTIFTGSSTSQHGYTRWNSDVPNVPSILLNEYDRYPTIFYLIFYLIKKQIKDFKVGAFVSWENYKNLLESKMINKFYVSKTGDKNVINEATKFSIKEKPHFMFVVQYNVTMQAMILVMIQKNIMMLLLLLKKTSVIWLIR